MNKNPVKLLINKMNRTPLARLFAPWYNPAFDFMPEMWGCSVLLFAPVNVTSLVLGC